MNMKMRTGLVVGFAAGYYLGAKAGRARYEQMRRWIDNFRQSRPYEKAQAALELSIERVRQQVGSEPERLHPVGVSASGNGPTAF
jgi:hypothetical protein